MRGSLVVAGGLFVVVACLSAPARAADYEEYQERVERANRMLEGIRTASAAALPSLRETAVEADLAVLEWLVEFMASEEYRQLPLEQQTAVQTDLYRWEYNLSIQLIGLQRCQEAADRLHGLLWVVVRDRELQARLIETYDEALVCAHQLATPQLVPVRIESATPGAQVSVDGEPVGPAPVTVQLAPGPHRAEIAAPGHATHTFSFTAELPEIVVGPVALAALTVEGEQQEERPTEPSRSPTWYEWTLWGVGAAGIGTAIGTFVSARNLEDGIENPPPGQQVEDPDFENGRVDSLETTAIVAGSIGLVSAVVGTVLFLMDDEEVAPDSSQRTTFLTPGGVGFRF